MTMRSREGDIIDASAEVLFTVDGTRYRWAGELVAVGMNQKPTMVDRGEAWMRAVPGPIVDLTLSFRADELEREQRFKGET